MVIDGTALIAILMGEPEAEQFAKAIAQDDRRLVCSTSAMQVGLAVEIKKGEAGAREFDLLMLKAGIEVVPLDHDLYILARRVWKKYGKGRHPAQLTMSDCCSYALSMSVGEPLLYKGERLRTACESDSG